MSDCESSISGEDLSISSSDESFSVSKLITEEDLIDSLFYTCDIEKTGKVPVSRLIEYLKFTTSSINDSENELVYLSSLLDADGNDSPVDLATYRDGIKQWIEVIRNRNEDWYDIDDVLLQNSMVPYRQTLSTNNSLSCSFIQGTSLLNSNLENSGVGDKSARTEPDPELLHRISDLQHMNKLLTEESAKLQQQIDILEETISSATSEKENLRTKIKCLQENVARKQEIQQENEDLKDNICRLQERRKYLDNRINILEKENAHLENYSSGSEKKINHLMSELEKSNNQCQQLMTSVTKTKAVLINAQEEKSAKETELSEKNAELAQLQRLTNELTNKTEMLKEENDELQLQIMSAQGDATNYQTKIETCVPSDSFDPDGDGCFMIVSSTPMKQQSICCELQETMGFDKLPSPLNEKEMLEKFPIDVFPHLGIAGVDYQELDPVLPKMEDDLSVDVLNLVEKFKVTQGELFSQLENAVQTVNGQIAEKGHHSLNIQNKFNTEIKILLDRVASLTKAKQVSDYRMRSLVETLKQMKEENSKLKRMQDEAMNEFSGCERIMENTVDNRLTSLKQELESNRTQLSAVREESEMKSQTMEKMSELEKSLKQEAELLRETNLDLTDKCHKADNKASELQEEISRVVETLKKERQKFTELESTSAAAKHARQLDLEEIWRIVQAVEKDYDLDKRSQDGSGCIDLLKEQISNEIESLKTKLVKRQAALQALVSKPKLRPLPLTPQCHCGAGCLQESHKNSPLVEALTIDFLNLHQRYKHGNQDTTTASPGCTILTEECQRHVCPGPMMAQACARSCPSLDQKSQVVTSGTQTDANNAVNLSQTNLANSNSSSTSGVLDLDFSSTSSRSIDGRNKRKDFLHSYLRFESDSQTSQSIESNTTDTDTAIVRQRSPSFRAAVEGSSNKTSEKFNDTCLRRNHSFNAALENLSVPEEPDFPRSRSLSFQTAIERGQLTPTDQEVDNISSSADITPENFQLPDQYLRDTAAVVHQQTTETKNVYFDMRVTHLDDFNTDDTEDIYDTYVDCSVDYQVLDDSQLEMDSDKRSPKPMRKLSTLIEEEDSSDGYFDHRMPPPPYSHTSRCKEAAKMKVVEHVAVSSSRSTEYPRISSIASVGTLPTDHKTCTRNEKMKPSLLSKSFSIHTEDEAIPHNTENDAVIFRQTNGETSNGPAITSALEKGAVTLVTRGAEDGSNPGGAIDPPVMDGAQKTDTVKESLHNGDTAVSPPPKLSKLREDNLARKREQMKHMTMPGLVELAENDTSTDRSVPLHPIIITNGDVTHPPPPSDDPIFPSIPDDYLQKLGLVTDMTLDKISPDQLSEEEIEHKFSSLALAFKTDKQTLEKRVDIQERARDIAEKNIDKELQGVRTALETLNIVCHDPQLQDVLQKIQHHVDIIEHTTARVSCRAEVFGAVQQEKRMSRAIEIMVHYVENIRRIHEREHSELEEARRLLQDSRPYGSTLDPTDLSKRRSTSFGQESLAGRGTRRRVSEVVLPKVLGGLGSTGNLSNLSQLDDSIFTECKQKGVKKDSSQSDDEDPKTRFQVAVATTSVRNMVSDSFRRASLDKKHSTSSSNSLSRENSQETKNVEREKSPSKQTSQEDDAFQKGFEQGYRAQLGQQLTSLRVGQSNISQTLDGIMDKYDEPEEEEKTLKLLLKEKAQSYIPHWEWSSAGKTVRTTMAGFIFLMAIVSIILSLFPVGSASLEVRAEYRHMGKPPL